MKTVRVVVSLAVRVAFGTAPAARAQQDSLPKFGSFVYVEGLPEAIGKVEPVYPDSECAAHHEGQVMVQALVDTTGRVRDVRLVKALPWPALNASATAAARQWTCKPAMSNGRPVAVWIAVPFRFGPRPPRQAPTQSPVGNASMAGTPPPADPNAPIPPRSPAVVARPDDGPKPIPSWPDVPPPAPNPMAARGSAPGGRARTTQDDISCGELLRHSLDELQSEVMTQNWIVEGPVEAWASCKRAQTRSRFDNRALLRARLETLDSRLREMVDQLSTLGAAGEGATPSPAWQARLTGRHATLEEGLAHVAEIWLEVGVDEDVRATAQLCDQMADRVASRVGAVMPREHWGPVVHGGRGRITVSPDLPTQEPLRGFIERLVEVYGGLGPHFRDGPELSRGTLAALQLLDHMEDELLAPGAPSDSTLPRTPRPTPRQLAPGAAPH